MARDGIICGGKSCRHRGFFRDALSRSLMLGHPAVNAPMAILWSGTFALRKHWLQGEPRARCHRLGNAALCTRDTTADLWVHHWEGAAGRALMMS